MIVDLVSPRQRTYLPGYDGLRAIACMAVFVVHLQQLTALTGRPPIRGVTGPVDFGRLAENGNTGVCLFFMLSGFLLSLPFWSAANVTGIDRTSRGSRWLLGYALRRLVRIIPAYYLCLTALILMGKASGMQDILLHYAFLHNFSEKSIYSISDPFWTLAVQAQFYILFAFLMLPLAPLARHRGVVFVLLITGIIGAYLAHHAIVTGATRGAMNSQVSHSVLRVSTLAHLPHFMLGMLAALLHAWGTGRPRTSDEESAGGSPIPDLIVLIAGLGILAILAVPSLDDLLRLPSRSTETRMIGRYNFPYIPLLIAVILICLPRTRLLASLLEWSPIRYVGVISFGIYVFHLPCLEICRKLITGGRQQVTFSTWLLAAAGVASAIAVASLSYWLVERPLARWVRKGS